MGDRTSDFKESEGISGIYIPHESYDTFDSSEYFCVLRHLSSQAFAHQEVVFG